MLKNYLSVALRHFRRAPVFTFINIFGLAVGFAVCALIALYVVDEVNFDRHHEHADRIVRIIETRQADTGDRRQAATPPRLATALLEDAPAVETTARFFALGGVRIRVQDTEMTAPMMYLADSTVFDVFTLPLLSGNPATALSAPNTLVMTETMAERLFGDADPIGREVQIDGNWAFTVTGILADQPRRSHLDMRLLGSFQTLYQNQTAERLSNWIWQQFFTYALLQNPGAIDDLARSLDTIEQTRANVATAEWGFQHDFVIQPLRDIYLKSGNLFFDIGPRGSYDRVVLFTIIGLMILLIACFNFMNLSTARSSVRAREVGLRKVIGAYRSQLIRQFLGESMLLAVAGVILALGLIAVASGFYESFVGKPFLATQAEILMLVLGAAVVVLVVGVLAGLYPALYLSAFQPATVLRGSSTGGTGGALLRRTLVVAQFGIAVGLIAGTGIVQQQLDYIQTRDLGYNRELLVTIPARGTIDDRADVFMETLLANPAIIGATASYGAPSGFAAGDGIDLPQRDDRWGINMFIVDPDFLEVYEMELVAGRAFDENLETDVQEAFILNETAALEIAPSPEQALGQEVSWERWDETGTKEGHVIGVVRDFNYDSIHNAISPMVLHMDPQFITHITVRLAPGRVEEGIAAITQTWPSFVLDQPVDYQFVDEDLANDYEAERRVATMNRLFSLLAILIACLGLFALSSYVVEQRSREIGVRKVLGATPAHIGLLISRQFLKLVLLSFLIGMPISYMLGNRWLNGFSYHTEVGTGFFLLVGLMTLGIAVLAIGSQALRAARLNPIENLRD